MKLIWRASLCIGILLLLVEPIAAKDRAVLKRVSETQYRVEVVIETPAQPGATVIAALYSIDKQGKRKQIQKFSGPLPPQSDSQQSVFSISLPTAPNEGEAFVVSVFEFPTASGTFSYDLPVMKLLLATLSSQSAQCPGILRLRLESPDYTANDWRVIDQWMRSNNQFRQFGDVKIVSGTLNSLYPIDSLKVRTPLEQVVKDKVMLVCLKPEPRLPEGKFNATVNFHNAPTFDLQQPIVGNALEGIGTPIAPNAAADTGVPGARGLERNLDLGLTFSSSVDEIENPDKTKSVVRNSRGTFDVRFAPLLNIEPYTAFDRNQKLYRYYTPISMDAAVSTGPITGKTLSKNRVIFGTEYEWRYYAFQTDPATGNTLTTPYPTFHRFIVRGTHASDRDFKQLEYAATAEYHLHLGALNHPLYLNWRFDANGFRIPGSFGYEVKLRSGFSLGRTYARREPAEAVIASPTVRRFHTGLDIILNITRYCTLSVNDTFYLRGEAPADRFHNHFKGGIEAPLGSPFSNAAHSLFLSFERGNDPPFATRDVNVLKIGYRIQAAGWFNRFR